MRGKGQCKPAPGCEGESARASCRYYGIAAAFVAAVFLAACAPLSEQERYERENRLNLAKEEFARLEAACRRAGGSIRMDRTPLSRNEKADYESARCVRY